MAIYPTYGKLLMPLEEEGKSTVNRTPMEKGAAKQAPKLSLQEIVRSVTYLYTAAELVTWKTFYRDELNRGADWFDWTDPVDAVVKQARMVNGEFKARPHRGTLAHFYVTFDLETLE